MELQHFTHHHPFVFNELEGEYCVCLACREEVSGLNYRCKECKWFALHKSCAQLPRDDQLQHPLHPKHPLILIDPDARTTCDNCKSENWALKYNCSHCEFNLCVRCASLPLTKEAKIHDHPLTLVRKSFSFTCDACHEEGKGMFYSCATCPFVVHPQCTSLPLIVQPPTTEAEIHDHPLTLMRTSILFTCDACGKEGRDKFYFCAICSFVAHQKCIFLPSIVKIIRHSHPLNLTYTFQLNQSARRVCQLCVKTVDTNYGVYYCSSCDFVTHLHCATSPEDRDETFMQKPKNKESIESSISMLEYEDPEPDESIDSLMYVVKIVKMGAEGIEIATEIKHSSHEHDLKLIDELEINEICDGCVRPIFPPFYACTLCGFFLHKSCAELPRKIRHSLHRHPLILLPRAPYATNLFSCDTCRCDCNGFTYHCKECQFDLDIQCSLISDIFKHECHKHQLILSSSSYGEKCSSCTSHDGHVFRCADCEFILDFKCATLPHTMRYGQHEHPFTLCYALEDDSGEYYCDICEEERDPKCWFYYCADCIYPAHLECILGKFTNVKFGKTRTFDIHQHPLTLVQKTKDNLPCEKCVDPCTDLAYECAKCHFNLHTYEWCSKK